MRLFTTMAAICLSAGTLFGDDSPSYDKSAYTLFSPTPAGQMRPLASDEFDKVINPFTVDAGHVQLETDLVEWYSETLRGSFSSGTTYDFDSQQFAWFPTLKHGLCNNDDLEMKPSYIDDASHKTGLNVPGKRPTP